MTVKERSAFLVWYPGSTMRIEVRGLQSIDQVDTASYVNDATVTIVLLDSLGAQVTGETWPVTLDYEAESDGNYSAEVSSSVSVVDGDAVTAKVTATKSGSVALWEIPVHVQTRTHRDN